MNIEVQPISTTRTALVVTLGADKVNEVRQKVIRQFSGQAALPGFRPGKAPAALVEKRFAQQIGSDVLNELVNSAYQSGLSESKLKVLKLVKAEPGPVSVDQPVTVRFEVDLQPEFELPPYKGIEVTVKTETVTDADVEAEIERARRAKAEFVVVERATAAGDYARIAYVGKLAEGSLEEIVGQRKIFAKAEQTWEEVGGGDGLIPGLALGLEGLSKGDKKTVPVSFPEDFTIEALRGKSAEYEVELLEVRERVLPAFDEAFVRTEGCQTIEQFRARVREGLGRMAAMRRTESLRQQVVEKLAGAIQTEFPEDLLESETQRMLHQFTRENLRRGVPAEEFELNKEALQAGARKAALDRLKVRFALGRIVDIEGIKATEQDILNVIYAEAQRAQTDPTKLVKQVAKDRERLTEIQRNVLLDKALEFVVAKATVSEASEPAAASA